MVYNLVFSGFPYLFIGYIFIIATTFHGSGMTDLLSSFYLLFAFYFIVNLSKFFTKN
jgi:hypothetical protein